MNKSERRRANPFYVLLVLVGIAFMVTAFAYFVMALKQVHADPALAADASFEAQSTGSANFVSLMDRYGVRLMVGELVILGIATFAAIFTDRHWDEGSPTSSQPNAKTEHLNPNSEL